MQQQAIEINKAALLLKLLADKTRLTIVKLLENNDYCVCEFVSLFNMSQPAISQHLRKLKDVGLIKESKKAQWVIYSLNKSHELYPFVQSILDHIPNQNEKLDQLEKKGLRIICN